MAERASLENWRPRKGSASSNLAPSANQSGQERNILCFSKIAMMFRKDSARVFPCLASFETTSRVLGVADGTINPHPVGSSFRFAVSHYAATPIKNSWFVCIDRGV